MVDLVVEHVGIEPASRTEADAWLRDAAKRTVRAHLSSREDAEFAQMVKSMTEQTQREYSGRFLFELLQNAFDRQPVDSRDGRVDILFARDEGAGGTLYVANTGQGFVTSNVRRIASLGLSDKSVGAGIGNKGVGFKSVLQISSTPEIYSTLPDGQPGFCFRFATKADILGLVDGDPVEAEFVRREMSLYNLTLPVESIPAVVEDFWSRGFATVVRLPLLADATRVVDAAVSELESSDVPVLLFLDRLNRVDVRHSGSGEASDYTLSRTTGEHVELGAAFSTHLVDLADEGEFLVLTRRVDDGLVHTVLRQAVAAEKLDERWAEWDEPVDVSVALPRHTDDAHEGRIYTYLPMGAKAPAPVAAHVNAPFFANLARTDIPTDHPLNDLLLHQVAALCLDAADAFASRSDESSAADALDVTTWSDELLPVLVDMAARSGRPLPERTVVPTRDPATWTTLREVRSWPARDTTVITAERVSDATGVRFLPTLPPGRRRRLDSLLASLDLDAEPSADDLAGWVQTALARMAERHGPIERWDAAYVDLARLFADNVEALRGRPLLLTDDWRLRPCAAARSSVDAPGSREATPFFPPVKQRIEDEDDVDPDADLDLPRSLARRVFYLHRDLTWYVNRQQTPARRFLQSNGLVRRFDTRSLLDHIRGVLTTGRKVADSTAKDALKLAFNLTRASSPGKADLTDLGLLVPTVDGSWIPARSALFSEKWPGTNGSDLATIGATPAERSTELHALGRRLLASPEHVVAKSGDLATWTRFLREVGVRDVIDLNSVRDERRVDGNDLVARQLAAVKGLPDDVRETWRTELPTSSAARNPHTPYKALSPVYWLPGQTDWDNLTDRVRRALTRQVIVGLNGGWDAAALHTTWAKDRQYDPDHCRLGTPLRAFLVSTAWLPVQHPGKTAPVLTRPASCWTHPGRDDPSDDGPPRFAPLLARWARDLLDDDTGIGIERLRDLGLGVWGSDRDAARLVRYLGRLAARGDVADVHLPQFEATYRAAWSSCASRGISPFPNTSRCHLLVHVGGAPTALLLEPVDSNAAAPEVVVASSGEDKSLLRLLADFRRNLLLVDSHVSAIVAMLRRRIGDRVVAAADIAPTVLIDGAALEPAQASTAPALVDQVPSLPILVGTLLDHRRNSFDRGGQRAFDQSLDLLRQVRLVRASRIEVRIGEEVRALPDRLHGVLPVPHTQAPTLVLSSPPEDLDWHVVEVIAEALLYLIGRPSLTDAFRLAATRLAARGAPVRELLDDDVATACGVTSDDVRSSARRVDTALTPVLTRLYPVLAHLAGTEAAALFHPESTTITSESELRESLAALAPDLPRPPNEVLDAALDAATIDELRRSLGIALAELNDTITRIGRPYAPIDHSHQHADDFADHVRTRRRRIDDRIRWARWPRFAAYEPQPDWPLLRRTDTFTPDPAWNTTVDELSAAHMDERLEAELTRLLGRSPPATGQPLPPADECSQKNTALVTSQIPRLTALVTAWSAKRGSATPSPWDDPDAAGRALLEALDGCGALAFAELSTPDILRWLGALELWPREMPASIDLTELGLTADDLDAQRAAERHRRDEAARLRRTVVVDDQPFDLSGGIAAFTTLLASSLARTPAFLAAPERPAKLASVPARSGRSGGGSGGGRSGGRSAGPSDEQRFAVGFAGEWLAFQWLQQTHGQAVTPECWVSAYRQELFADPGDDNLGWDFAVPGKREMRYYEVKTTTGDGGQIELGESQVRAAQNLARRESHWRLIVITNALNDKRCLHLLPNPFHDRARNLYTFAGNGLRLRYELS
jgi:hypothetical protein